MRRDARRLKRDAGEVVKHASQDAGLVNFLEKAKHLNAIHKDAAPGVVKMWLAFRPATALLTCIFVRQLGTSKLFDEKVPHL
jgi:hypothetical protein